MARLTISLPEDLHQMVRIRAADRGMSMAAFIREAIEEKVESSRPKPKSSGIGASA